MPRDSSNPPPDRPLSEEHILDWVEGRLDEASQARLLAASGRAGLRDRVTQMQANRRALQSAGVEKAPRGLADRVVAALEREALVGMERSAPPVETAPIQFSDHVRGAGQGRWSRAAPGLAMAAGLTLLVVGGAYWSTLLFSGGPRQAPPSVTGPLATRDAATEPAPNSVPGVLEAPSAALAAASESSAPVEPAPPAPVTLAAAEPVTPERAAELARMGRLVIRVSAGSTRALAQLESMGNGMNHRPWRLQKDVPASVSASMLAAVAAPAVPADFVGPVMASADPARVASLIAPMVGPRAAFNLTPPRVERDGAVIAASYLLEVPADAESIEGVARLIGERLKGEVRLESLPEAAPSVPATPDADSLLWWTQPPQNWTARASVPLVIEERE